MIFIQLYACIKTPEPPSLLFNNCKNTYRLQGKKTFPFCAYLSDSPLPGEWGGGSYKHYMFPTSASECKGEALQLLSRWHLSFHPFRRSECITRKTHVHPSASQHRRQLRQVLINRRRVNIGNSLPA